jgi:hypothetical protein
MFGKSTVLTILVHSIKGGGEVALGGEVAQWYRRRGGSMVLGGEVAQW